MTAKPKMTTAACPALTPSAPVWTVPDKPSAPVWTVPDKQGRARSQRRGRTSLSVNCRVPTLKVLWVRQDFGDSLIP